MDSRYNRVKPHYERGRQKAYQKAIEAVRKMLDRGYDINEICKLTSLTRKEVAKLSQEK